MNHQITASTVRVIDQDGKQVGIMPLGDALKKSQREQLDLIEIAANANPPVVKIIDFKRFKYLQEKKEKEARKHTKQTELKEVRFSPFIGQHDLQTALDKVKKFLSEGDLVKINIMFSGRQMAHKEFGPKLLEKVLGLLKGLAEPEREAKFEGRRYVTIVKPTKEAQRKIGSKNEAKN